MLKVNIGGAIGRFGYANLPDDMTNDIISAGLDQAFLVATMKAPVDSGNLKYHIRKRIGPEPRTGYVFIKTDDVPYAFAAEFGTKHRLPHPFMRPAAKAAKAKMTFILRKAVKAAIEAEKAKIGGI